MKGLNTGWTAVSRKKRRFKRKIVFFFCEIRGGRISWETVTHIPIILQFLEEKVIFTEPAHWADSV